MRFSISKFLHLIVCAISFVSLLSTNVCSFAAGPYCGVYSLYGAAVALGVDVDMVDLISARYISSSQGSSSCDLQLAANEIGLRATPLFGLGRYTLRHANEPLILHVSPRGTVGTYVHWLLFLGIENDKAIVYDGPGGIVQCSLEQVLARWDGNAIAISKASAPATGYLSAEIGIFALYLVCIIFAIAGSHRFVFASVAKVMPRFAAESLLIGLVSVGFAFANHAFNRTGRDGKDARASIDSASGLKVFDHVDATQLMNLIRDDKVVLIDCRLKRDFIAGSILSSVNLPIDAGMGEFKRVTGSISKTKRIVLFCQSEGCHFSEYAATMFSAEGFDDIQIFKGGYAEWQSVAGKLNDKGSYNFFGCGSNGTWSHTYCKRLVAPSKRINVLCRCPTLPYFRSIGIATCVAAFSLGSDLHWMLFLYGHTFERK